MKKNGNITAADPAATNQFRNGTVIEGNINSDGDVRIEGVVKGNIDVKGRVIIGNTGEITGDIKCAFCDISGSVTGKLNISDSLTLKASANYTGEISTKKITIEPGAVFNGSCSMTDNKNGEKNFKSEKR